MRTTLKKVLCIFWGAMLVCATSVIAYEGFDTKCDEECSPWYVELKSIVTTLSIDNSGIATCYCDVTTRHIGSSVTIKMELQQKQPSGWETIKSWSKTDECPFSLERSYAVTKGYDYQLCVTATVYDNTGNKIEQGTSYSSIEHY